MLQELLNKLLVATENLKETLTNRETQVKQQTNDYHYQTEGIQMIEDFGGRALLSDEMGLGKTFQALKWLENHPEIPFAIVVCPASLKWHWKREGLKHCGPSMTAHVLGSRKANPNFKPSRRLVIINYDVLVDWLEVLDDLDPDLVILDEGHYIQSLRSQRTRASIELCKGAKHVIIITGTPVTQRPSEVWPLLHILQPRKYSKPMPFYKRYCQPKRRFGRWEFKGATRLMELNLRLRQDCMIRRLKKDVLQDLPPKTRTVLPIGMEDRQEYSLAERDFLRWIHTYDPKKARAAQRAEALVKTGYLLRLVGRKKLKFVCQWIDNFFKESEEKLIVFTRHKAVMEHLYTNYHHKCVKVDGEVVGRKRDQAVQKFREERACSFFIGQIHAAGVGWDGSCAGTVAFAELAWTPGAHLQAEDRPHRIGQKGNVNCVYLVAHNTIEERLCKILQKKQENVEQILDGTQRATQMDVFNLLIGKLQRSN